MKDVRFFIVVALLGATAWLLLKRGHSDAVVDAQPLSGIPRLVDGLTGTEQPIDRETRDVLGAGDFLYRLYTDTAAHPLIGLFVAYFPSQRTGSTIHSPKNCLPGAGWSFQSAQYVTLRDAAGRPHSVGEYLIAQGDEKQFVIYWYEAHGRSVASEYKAKVYLVLDAIRTNRTDGALVRVTTPVLAGEDTSLARARAEAFAKDLLPSLGPFIPG